MLKTLVSTLVLAAGSYLALGSAFALAFVLRGAARLDPLAAHGSAGFRLAIFPAAVVLWPYLAWRWHLGAPPAERNAHRDRASAGGER